ncbi:spore germination protein [Bacillus cereus group sp. N6]|uniref:spore germination protein n=1 Tax=Bacillus cereus group sp. N6 TaxID=2794583 RepID=UPI0018F5658A|nr:spore germination protein [Bacillus cereus group sp. N6]MBJ8113648.1 spore germination protein [Bacillus cereus group sp. N6]
MTIGHFPSTSIANNIKEVQSIFHHASDLIIQNICVKDGTFYSSVLYLDSLTNKEFLHNHIINPLRHHFSQTHKDASDIVGYKGIVHSLTDIEKYLLEGKSILLIEGNHQGYYFDTATWPERSPQNFHSELSIKSTQQSFVESLTQNIALIRRYIPTADLIIHDMKLARQQKNSSAILYLKKVAADDILSELIKRLEKIPVDFIMNMNEIVEYIEDDNYSPFPQFLLTERPDLVAAHLMEGGIALLLDNSSQILLAPVKFVSFFQIIDDYGSRWYITSFIRLLRFFSFIIALFLPSIYIALLSFHFEVIPIQLFFSIAESRAQVPFPTILEAFLMLVVLELMREAAIRLPAPIGPTVGIVSGTIIGQAAVQTGLVSNAMVIVIGVTALASYILPNYDMGTAVRLLRFPLMVLATCFGLVGIIIGWMLLLIHLISLESLGTPYGRPFAPLYFKELKDSFVRFPLKFIHNKCNR